MSAPVREARPWSDTAVQPWIEVVRVVDPVDRGAALEIRRSVFAEEQHVSDLRVADPDDERSIIALASFQSPGAHGVERVPVSTGRLTLAPTGGGAALIAWVATLPEARGRGAGGAVMRFLLDQANAAGAREVTLAAQAPAEHFYRQLGFEPAGPTYDVRGIPHRKMVRRRA